ncbi:hypothetical protein ACIRU5_19260 [Streptomyces misionensis]|uniref:hypothetical protein n=1 Tax=Streptomyces misionensis TaxID=67331 RepID=UPI0038143D3D
MKSTRACCAWALAQRAIDVFQATTALACFLHLPDLTARLSAQDRGGDWQLPENPVPTSTP